MNVQPFLTVFLIQLKTPDRLVVNLKKRLSIDRRSLLFYIQAVNACVTKYGQPTNKPRLCRDSKSICYSLVTGQPKKGPPSLELQFKSGTQVSSLYKVNANWTYVEITLISSFHLHFL